MILLRKFKKNFKMTKRPIALRGTKTLPKMTVSIYLKDIKLLNYFSIL
jgi:hypothetical protein